jgi:hypothetical protein
MNPAQYPKVLVDVVDAETALLLQRIAERHKTCGAFSLPTQSWLIVKLCDEIVRLKAPPIPYSRSDDDEYDLRDDQLDLPF